MSKTWRLVLLCSGLRNRPVTFSIALIAFLFGLFLSGLCLQFLLDLQFYTNRQLGQDAGSGHLVLSKDISPLMALRPEIAVFSAVELKSLKATSFVQQVDPVIGNQFRSELFFQLGEFHYGTELFFEAVPDPFLAPVPKDWEWAPPTSTGPAQPVPIIIPEEFLTLYNLGFAPSRNLPVLQDSMLAIIPLRLRIEGQVGGLELPARIVGTTNKIASLLVPMPFMVWANANYSVHSQQPSVATKDSPRRLIVTVNDPAAPAVAAFLHEHGYRDDTTASTVREAALLLLSVVSITGLVALLILGLAALVFLLNLRLFLHERSGDLRLLVLLGHNPHHLALLSVSGLFIPLGLFGLALLGLLSAIMATVYAYLAKSGFSFLNGLAWQVWLLFICCLIALPLIQYFSIRQDLALPLRIGQNSVRPK